MEVLYFSHAWTIVVIFEFFAFTGQLWKGWFHIGLIAQQYHSTFIFLALGLNAFEGAIR